METKTLAGINVDFDDQGYMTDLDQWNKVVGQEIAAEENIEMTERHWEVIHFIQTQFQNEVPLTIRKIGKSGVVTIKEFYQLFPDGPLKKASRIAGIPKPKSCI